jgi:hypothetical protein
LLAKAIRRFVAAETVGSRASAFEPAARTAHPATRSTAIRIGGELGHCMSTPPDDSGSDTYGLSQFALDECLNALEDR